MLTLSGLLEEIDRMKPDTLLRLIVDVQERIRSEREKEACGSTHITGGLVTFDPKGSALVVGDLHGDFTSLRHILADSDILEKLKRDFSVIFLGDYGDRGAYSPEVYYAVLRMKAEFPDRIVLLRGNHEGPRDLLALPHDLPHQFQERFGSEGKRTYESVIELFPFLYHAVIVPDKYLLVHGGVPSDMRSMDDLARADRTHPHTPFLEEILWSDPREQMEGAVPSPRGAGKLFGPDVTERALRLLNVKTLIRGHEPAAEGYAVSHNGRVLTLFSRIGFPYFNLKGAFLTLDLNRAAADAWSLLDSVSTVE